MLIIWLLTIGISFLYFYLLRFYSDHWHALPETKSPDSFIAQEGVTIVIIAHNEAATIGSCLEGILSQDRGHSGFEIIVVDDHSTDQTKEVVENLHKALRIILKGTSTIAEAIERITNECKSSKEIEYLIQFMRDSKRGLAK